VEVFVRETEAPATGTPAGSVTRPLTAPWDPWPNTPIERSDKAAHNTTASLKVLGDISLTPNVHHMNINVHL
jgi:hypothetical protein